MDTYNIEVLKSGQRHLTINKNLADKYNLSKVKSILVRFGLKIMEVKLFIEEEHANMYIGLSKDIIEKLGIPTYCNFNIYVNSKKEIVIGPFIGLFMGKKESTIIKKLRVINSFVQRYDKLNGAVFAFSLDNINKKNLTMDGYVFNPILNIWQRASLPFPAAIYKRSVFNTEWREYFGSIYGNKVFNYNSFDKWEMYERLRQFEDVRYFLPDTKLYKDLEDIWVSLSQYENIYIKPIDGKQGLGIFNVVKNEKSILVKTRKKGENLSWSFTNKDDFLYFISQKLEINKYIIQQTLDIQIDSKAIDFRIGMDKDQLGKWNDTTFLSRVSGNESIVSNRAAGGGEVKEISDTLKEIYKMNDVEKDRYQNELISLAYKASIYLEETGLSLGKLAFDMAIDSNNKIWIVEINSRYPDDSLVNSLGKRHVYYDTRHLNMLYAKKLSGFDHTTNDLVFNFAEFQEEIKSEEVKKIKVYVGVPLKEREGFKEYLAHIIQESILEHLVSYDKSTQKFELVLEGSFNEIVKIIKRIKSNDNNKFSSVVSIIELD